MFGIGARIDGRSRFVDPRISEIYVVFHPSQRADSTAADAVRFIPHVFCLMRSCCLPGGVPGSSSRKETRDFPRFLTQTFEYFPNLESSKRVPPRRLGRIVSCEAIPWLCTHCCPSLLRPFRPFLRRVTVSRCTRLKYLRSLDCWNVLVSCG